MALLFQVVVYSCWSADMFPSIWLAHCSSPDTDSWECCNSPRDRCQVRFFSVIRFEPNLGRKCHLYSFAWCFSYLTFFRLSGWVGLPPPPSHTNAIIRILTLKLVGLAFEVILSPWPPLTSLTTRYMTQLPVKHKLRTNLKNI